MSVQRPIPLFSKFKALELKEADIQNSSATTIELSKVKAQIDAHERKVFALAKKHISSNFPSYYSSIASSRMRTRRKYGSFFRDMNLHYYPQKKFSNIFYDDKLIFDATINALGHATPRLVWMINRSKALSIYEKKERNTTEIIKNIIDANLFAKPRIGEGGKGTFLIQNGEMTFANGIKIEASADNLMKTLSTNKGKYLLQEVVNQVGAISAFNPSSLNTIRCLSYLDNSGRPHVVGATFRVGVGTGVVDNASSGGLFCGIDINQRSLHAHAMNKNGDVFTRHPTSSIEFENYKIPGLESVFRLCAQCHEGIGAPKTVGWDVAISPRGPVLLEGNTRWMAKLHTKVDPRVAARLWSAHIDDWGHLDIGFGDHEIARQAKIENKCIMVSVTITGKVQKVGFRQWIAKRAKARELSGHVKNLEDGSLRVVLMGPIRRVETMLMLLATGPARASITNISIHEVEISDEDSFAIIT